MKLYTAFDLHANNIYGAIIGEQGQRVKRQRLASDQEPLAESIRDAKVELLDASFVKAYVDDLKALLSKGSIVEQKSFLRSFVKRIEVNLPQVVIDYAIPLETKDKKVEPLSRKVLPFAYSGSPDWHPKAYFCGIE